MQMVKRIVGGFFLSFILLWLFAPKVELYYLLEKSLKEKNIIISNETITDTWYGLKIENADLYLVDAGVGAKIINIEELHFNFLLFYNTLTIQGVNSFSNLAPKEITNLNATYSLLTPLKVKLDGEGSFGVINGTVALRDRRVEILFPVVRELKTIKKFLKKDKEKGWLYETSY